MSAELTVCDEAGNRLDMQYYVVRPAVYCAMCGGAALTLVQAHDQTRREAWCAVPSCAQYNKRIMLVDPIARGSALPTSQ